MSPAGAPLPQGAPPVLLISAVPPELAGARRILRLRKAAPPFEGAPRLFGDKARRVVAASVGVGRGDVERTLPRLLQSLKPRACAFLGFGGACVPDLFAGDLVLGTTLLCEPSRGPDGSEIAGRAPIEIAPALIDAARHAAASAHCTLREGPIVSVNVVAIPSAKDSLGRNRGALCCDMEAFFAARVCANEGVPFLCVRAIFDRVDEALPEVPPTGTLRAMLRRPAHLRHLPWLARRYSRARSRLDPFGAALARRLQG
ncbi:MAG: phosphorylase family protein [Planctomycetota bacterium]